MTAGLFPKSTTAASVAVAAFQQGAASSCSSSIRQGTLSDWADARRADVGPEFERIDATDLEKALGTLREAAYDLASSTRLASTARRRSAPCERLTYAWSHAGRPRPICVDCLPTVQSLIRLEKPFAFVLSQCPPRSARVEETRAGLSALGLIAEPPIVSRADHQDAMAAGMGVTEFNEAERRRPRSAALAMDRRQARGETP